MKVCAVQFRPDFADAEGNAGRIAATIREQAAQGAKLLVFPEAAVTGYCFRSAEEARAASVSVDSSAMGSIRDACADSGAYAVVGFAERSEEALFNSAAFYSPKGLIGVYRKTHIPCLGLDRFVSAGSELEVFDTPIGKIGILICFDIRFPESARTLSLKGAELICLPTNWPQTADPASDIICPARTIENNIFVAASNRVGEENGFRFIGKSKIIAPGGTVLASLNDDSEGVICADLNLELAREKRVVKRPGEYEMDLFGARRPELYRS